jgi:hypothetical protein
MTGVDDRNVCVDTMSGFKDQLFLRGPAAVDGGFADTSTSRNALDGHALIAFVG